MSTGRLTASRMMARVRTPPAGMPAAPTLDAVAVTLGEERGGQGSGKGLLVGEATTGVLLPPGCVHSQGRGQLAQGS